MTGLPRGALTADPGTQVIARVRLSTRAQARAARDPYRRGMTTSRIAGWHRLASRAAAAGLILGIASLAVGLFIMVPLANHSSSDDSPASVAAIALVSCGLAAAAASAVLWAGEALRWRARGHRAGKPLRPR